MKKLLILLIIQLFLVASLFAQNRLWGITSSYMPIKSTNSETYIFNTDLSGDDFAGVYSVDSIIPNGSNWARIPTGKLLYNKNIERFYVPIYNGNGNYINYIMEYDKQLNEMFINYFDANDMPIGNLLEYSDSIIYGFTKNNYGHVYLYEYNALTKIITKKVNLSAIGIQFTDYNNYYPEQSMSSLVKADDGNIYGLTHVGGLFNNGFIFMYDVFNDTLIKKLDFDSLTIPNGYLFKTKANKIYGAFANKIYEYNYINNTISSIYQSQNVLIPNNLTEGYNNEFYGYSINRRYLIKIDINNDTSMVIYNSFNIPIPSSSNTGDRFFFNGHPTFTSKGEIVGEITAQVDDYMGYHSSRIYLVKKNFLNNYILTHKDYYSLGGEPYLNHILLEICYPQTINTTQIILNTDSMFLEGAYQNTIGYYYDTLYNFCGEDSLVITNLIIADVLNQDTTIICNGDTAFWGTQVITTSGLYYEIFNTTSGDSISSIQVIVNPSYNFSQTYKICNYDSILFAGNYYGTGNYQINNTTINGCDSIINISVNDITPYANVYINPNISFVFQGQEINIEGPGNFFSNSYQWDISPATCSYYYLGPNNFIICITFNDTIEYTVTLIVSNSSCSDTSYTKITPKAVIGIGDNIINTKFNIYPNPASTFVQVESRKLKVESCSVLDIYGRTIREFKIQDSEFKINIENLPKGIYFIKLQTEEGIAVKKIVKQ